MNKDKECLMGEYSKVRRVNGVTVYTGGQPGSRRIAGTMITISICCLTCRFCKPYVAKNMVLHHCMSVITDTGRALDIGNRKIMRCTNWQIKPRLTKLGKSSGKVDSIIYIKWKLDNPDIVNNPQEHGCKPMETPREFLYRKFLESCKKKNTPIK